MKMKLKVTTTILMSLFLVSVIAVSTHAKPTDTNRLLMIDIMAKGDDLDIPGATVTTTIIARIEFDKVSGEALGQVEFHIKIYDESGEKIYSMMGKLKNGMVIPGWFFDCDVRHVFWINLWLVMGPGMIKTTDIDLVILYRGNSIALPNTEGKWSPETIVMLVSPYGQHDEGYWPEGGWAFAGLYGFVGGVTYLTKYMEKWVPDNTKPNS